MTNWNPVAVIGVVALMVVVIAIGLLWGAFANGFSSNGERIYFTGSNEGGVRITYRGGPAFGSPGMMMNTQLSCASCHGVNARGGITPCSCR